MTFKKGDLVMVVRPTYCCGGSGALGQIHEVAEQALKLPFNKCVYCGEFSPSGDDDVLTVDGAARSRSRLIKINPPADDTEEVADKELETVK